MSVIKLTLTIKPLVAHLTINVYNQQAHNIKQRHTNANAMTSHRRYFDVMRLLGNVRR